ncbi:MAG: hypothetical protein A3B38_02765 [Candidatus Levybacteria bacterium RIFCSPLOWO2_01_FULL_36_13]|nr:MAG: hypothetical protein A2684_01485 [Candidatus Levybacteria bacterium RIFCSPHIGHO2_01_FULL_36_15b]OGH35117.1 MAG: hypothetical protein A3B38_02765 [Candidatus Levybacteria bacterium RIFCSPLOWO2_01_FULL_36_13]
MAVELEPQRLRAQEVADLDPYKIRQPQPKETPKALRKPRVKRNSQKQTPMVKEHSRGIENLQKQMIDSVKTHIKEQRELWKLIPALYLEEQGRDGYNDDAAWICGSKLLPISEGGNYDFIDLEKATIVHWDFQKHVRYKANDNSYLEYASKMDKLDAVEWVEMLLEVAQEPYGKYIAYTVEHVEQWREEQRQDYGLQKPDFEKVKQVLGDYKKAHGIA